MMLTKATPKYIFKLYKFYLNLERDHEARLFYRYLSMRSFKGKLYAIIKLCYDLLLPSFLPIKTLYYLIINNNEILGACHITVYKFKKYAIYGIVLSRLARGKGLGKILSLYAIIDTLKTYNPKMIYLYVDVDNIKAIKLYHKLGFKMISVIRRYDYRYISKKYVDGYLMLLNVNEFIRNAIQQIGSVTS